MQKQQDGTEIAVVGMAGRFPGASDLDQLWSNLRDGVESIRRLSAEEIAELGVDPELGDDPHYVPAVSLMDGYADFDAGFFGINPREAEIMDPQHRVLLECAWEALENAAYDPRDYPGMIGIYAGATLSTYLVMNLVRSPRHLGSGDPLELIIGNAGDTLTTRVSYLLDLKGPSHTVQCACSTSLVAVHLACQSLLNEECDMALAGGVSVNLAYRAGYRHLPESILSPDGHCRAFDAAAAGTVFGSGVGLVVLKRLEDALAAGDAIRAVILGSAVNNDGRLKVGYTAPAVEGQARVISDALAYAGIDAETVSYVEAHGSGTALGDPVEIQALTRAFRAHTRKTGFCALGSVKSNFGHLDVAAGVAGLIKTVLALENGLIPPSLHFEKPNPKIDFEASPVYVNAELRRWPESSHPRRAGVSSFGLGGTNAHVVLEEAPPPEPSGEARPWQLLTLSAKSDAALEAADWALGEHLRRHPDCNLEDVAYTLQVGRRRFEHRRILLCRTPEPLAPERVMNRCEEASERPVAFLFPGVGDHYVEMGRGLYRCEPTFRKLIDRGAELLTPHLGCDLRELLYPPDASSRTEPAVSLGMGGGVPPCHKGGSRGDQRSEGKLDLRRMLGRGEGAKSAAESRLDQTLYAQPATFVLEYALARLWMEWGIVPKAMIGYSLGEYVAACLGGVLSLEDALTLVAARARMIQELPAGAMLGVTGAARSLLGEELCLAAVNGPEQCVVAGPPEAVAALELRLKEEGLASRRVPTTHAFHSAMMEPIGPALVELVKTLELKPPEIPYISNLTGTWITAEEATDPTYWARHLCATIRFADGIGELYRETERILLEVGPGQTLGTLVRLQPECTGDRQQRVLASLPHVYDQRDDVAFLLASLGQLWLTGAEVDWPGFYAGRRRRRLPLPTYPFARQRYWVEGEEGTAASGLLAPAKPSARPEAPGPAAHARPKLRSDYVEPRTDVERQIARIWEQVLGVEQVGRDDNFFELNGHSLLATQVASRLRELFRVEVTLERLLAGATVATMAAAVGEELAAGRVAATAAEEDRIPPRRPRSDTAPLSFAQERMWFLDQLDPDTTAFSMPFAFRLHGPLRAAILERAFDALVRRHEVLRTTFRSEQGRPLQVIAGAGRCALPVVDLSVLRGPEREHQVRLLTAREASQPFDLGRGPLLRTTLLRQTAAEHVLLLSTHHIISDGWSMGLLLRELAALYAAFGGDPEVPPLAALPIQYADFAVWQRQHLVGEVLANHLAYWQEQLADRPPPLPLPTDRPRSADAGFRIEIATRPLARDLVAGLETLSQRHAATLFMVLLAAFQLLLYRYTGERDLVVGCPIANRNRREIEELIGFFLNTLMLRTRFVAGTGFGELLAAVRRVALDGYAHQDLPVESLIGALQAESDTDSAPFNVMFLLQNFPLPERWLGDVRFELMEGLAGAYLGTAIFDLCLAEEEFEERPILTMTYNANLFDGATVARQLGHLQALLEGLVKEPDRRPEDLPLLGAAERHQLLSWSDQGLVLDDRLHLCPIGIFGELFAAPDEPAPESPRAAAERWLPDPFSEHPGRRLRRTGERVRRRPDGRLEDEPRDQAPLPDAAEAAGDELAEPPPFVEPETDAEVAVAEIFAEILGVDRIGVDDDFFELGGHSLVLPRIVHRVSEVFQVEVPLRALYDEPTVAGLAEVVEELILDQIENLTD